MSLRLILLFLLSLLAGPSLADTGASFSLHGGQVRFTAPADWPVIMQMTEGDRQVVAFQVKDPADTNSGEASRVSVSTRKLDDAHAFQEFVNAASEKARQTPGYAADEASNGGSNLRYSGLNAKTPYQYRESYYYQNGLGIQLRCVHPVLKATTRQWLSDFDAGCEQIAASLAH